MVGTCAKEILGISTYDISLQGQRQKKGNWGTILSHKPHVGRLFFAKMLQGSLYEILRNIVMVYSSI